MLRRELRVDLTPDRAIHLFTPVGERRWAEGWDPHFPDGEHGDGGAVGTVFVTGAHGRTTHWVVAERTEDSIRYARITPGHLAGLVDVQLRPGDGGGTIVTVAYRLSALTPDADPEFRQFADGFEAFIDGWEQAVAEVVASGRVE